MAESLKRPGLPLAVGMRMKVSFTKLREFLTLFAKARAQNGGAESLKPMLKWLEPFGPMQLRLWSEEGMGRGSLSWEMHDVLSYD